ncbi:MAG: exosome complex RNA-binding protein Csl4 [Candidatus Altiarchaeota archaeon]|nr:exosome complex RNA-binding protein Csl4 [Candidatus Altiarchaeota archaeon]
MDKDKVMIGDYIGTIEEFLPGDGTYSEDGKIFAANIGTKVVDSQKHVAMVEGKTLPSLKVGQIVFGEVATLKKNVINVMVSKIQGQKGVLNEKTMIYVSNISENYVERPEDMFGIGDVVKAKVIKIEPGMIDISTKGGMGVVKAFCRRCRSELLPSAKFNGKMECPMCGQIEVRKVSDDYGNVKLQ